MDITKELVDKIVNNNEDIVEHLRNQVADEAAYAALRRADGAFC